MASLNKGYRIDLSGYKFNMMTVLKFVEVKNKNSMWLCRCDCGNTKVVYSNLLKSGMVKSCGCLLKKSKNKTHGLSKSHEFSVWASIHQRCKNKNTINYEIYGGRGISVANTWDDFNIFFKDMGPRPSNNHQIDRIDNNGDYCKENCRWVTRSENINNRRNTVYIEQKGRKKSLSEWADIIGVSYQTIYSRYKRNMSVGKILNNGLIIKRSV